MFLHKVEHVSTGFGRCPERECRGHEVAVGIDYIGAGQLVTVPLEDSLDSEPTDLKAMTMHAAAFPFIIELIGNPRHLSKREEAVDAILAACDVIPRLKAAGGAGIVEYPLNKVVL